MKNTIKLLGIIALVAIIGFAMLACDTGGDDDDEDPVPAAWRGTWTGGGTEAGQSIIFTGTTMRINEGGGYVILGSIRDIATAVTPHENPGAFPNSFQFTGTVTESEGAEAPAPGTVIANLTFHFNADYTQLAGESNRVAPDIYTK